jgi:DNA gyrase subunit A
MPKKPTDDPKKEPPRGEEIIEQEFDEVIHNSMIPYAESVILDRALPRVEDGLKPVQRRILYTMMELGTTPDKPHRKSARIVGDTMGKYHPHGDSSIYEAMVRMAQDFNMRGMLVDGHGNYGSIDGDSAAAMRYTEARMTPLALEMLRDIEKDTVSFSLNFDDTLKEPDMLPGRFPNLLVNGALGIAVGLATNIPTHNLGEAIDAVVAQIDDPDITVDGLMEKLKGPDFPTGGFIVGDDGIRQAYETGRGKVVIRAKTEIEKASGGKQNIVITELPYQVNKAKLLEAILAIQEAQKGILGGINDIRDESDRNGMRAVIEVKKDADPEKILEYLYKYSDLQTNYNVNMVAIAEGRPMLLNLRQINAYYIRHQQDVVTRRTQYDLEKAEEREHILEGLLIAIANIDEVIRIIKTSKSVPDAKTNLMKAFALTGVQAQAILDMRLARLTALEVEKLEEELREVRKLIKELKAILASKKKLMEVIKGELGEIRRKYADARRTKIVGAEAVKEFRAEDFVVVEDTVVIATRDGYVKRMQPNAYGRSNRAAPPDGLIGDDSIMFVETGTTALRAFFLTDMGSMVQLSVNELPDMRWRDRGEHLSSIVSGYGKGERLVAMFVAEKLPDSGRFVFFTEGGMVKCTEAAEYETRNRKIAACGLKAGDRILSAELCTDEAQCVLVTRDALGISFRMSEVEPMGRATKGVRAIALNPGDLVVGAFLVRTGSELLLLSDKGYCKRVLALAIPVQARAGRGGRVFAFAKNGSNGSSVKAALRIDAPFDLLISQKSGAETTVNTATVAIEGLSTGGKPVTFVMMDDEITKANRLPG